jgi:hypothetical protein
MNNVSEIQNQLNSLKIELFNAVKNFTNIDEINKKTENLINSFGNIKCLIENIPSLSKLINESVEAVLNKQRRSFIIIGIFVMLMFIIPLIITFYFIGTYTQTPIYITIIGFIITLISLLLCVIFIYNIFKNIFQVSISTTYTQIIKKLETLCKN